ncbi:hypothetical protein G9F72_018845 [Clostridium estertheticum]|uniref:hypothetical protein n=1 Tax=Clostridium estertheticum TaxID=238834 RepID=UPI0013E935A8|nr:hypothetical protein [Clostridium estertheticum]MBZ9688391.1 hypothetical protein [Clostridium estertheticum]
MFSSIINYITSHPEVIWSGFGIFVLGLIFTITKFFVTHEIIEKSEYKSLQNIKNNFIDIEKLKSDLEFNHDLGIYIDMKTNENFCPTCLTNKDKKNHLKEITHEVGIYYQCPVCRESFESKEFKRKLDKAIKQSDIRTNKCNNW